MKTKSPKKETLNSTVAKAIKEKFQIKNVNAVPRVIRAHVNVGIGSYVNAGNKDFAHIIENVSIITGQKPIVTKAKKAISNFKLREGMPVGVSVTLRKNNLESFLVRLINIALPRVRDFRGLTKKSFDGKGNLHIGIKECNIFPEVNPDDISKVHGMQISIITSAKNDEEGFALLESMGFPFKESKNKSNN
jgi:large subunit ribosomal protein L5